MAESIVQLMAQLEKDSWRTDVGFSLEVQNALQRVLVPGVSEAELVGTLNEWISKYQPCLFGRLAAKQNSITYCILRESDLKAGDEQIKTLIQDARLRWTKAGFNGESSNFIIAVLSEQLAFAKPGPVTKKIALRLCSLYLQEPVEADRIYLDHIYLEVPGAGTRAWEWVAGVNYFSAQGDKRWWQDHRFPAGIAFSTNSVGHMVKSGKLQLALQHLNEVMDVSVVEYKTSKVDSLEKALELAMRTIYLSSEAVSGKATYLIPSPGAERTQLRCPIELPKFLADSDYCNYKGFYHTDYTIPSEYFLPAIFRNEGGVPFNLDFTYLFDASLDNPDFDRMGAGRAIRADGTGEKSPSEDAEYYPLIKRLRGVEVELLVDNVPRLRGVIK